MYISMYSYVCTHVKKLITASFRNKNNNYLCINNNTLSYGRTTTACSNNQMLAKQALSSWLMKHKAATTTFIYKSQLCMYIMAV